MAVEGSFGAGTVNLSSCSRLVSVRGPQSDRPALPRLGNMYWQVACSGDSVARRVRHSLAPTLEEKQKGFKSQHLELFSADKIKVLRIYDTTQGEFGFYIMEVEGEVCVFEYDTAVQQIRNRI